MAQMENEVPHPRRDRSIGGVGDAQSRQRKSDRTDPHHVARTAHFVPSPVTQISSSPFQQDDGSRNEFRISARICVTVKPPTVADLTWIGDLKFSAKINRASTIIDSAGLAGPSPVESLAAALAGCMSTDLVHILTKGRHSLRALRSHLVGHRAQQDPHRFVRIELSFTIDGEVPDDAIDRAIELSREKYCSVWHSMRQDIDFVVTWGRG